MSTFHQIARIHPIDLVSPGFVVADHTEAHRTTTLAFHPAEISAPFIGAELAATGEGTAAIGIRVGDATLLATRDPSGVVQLVLRSSTRARVLATGQGGAGRLGFALCENQATALIRHGASPWRAVATTTDLPAYGIDLRQPEMLRDVGFTWGAVAGQVDVSSARAGVFGMVGLRDPHLVQTADGAPLIEDGHAYLTWTCAGPGFFRQAHWGVFRLDLARPTRLEQVAHIFTERDGLVLGDHAGQLVRDGDEWIVLTSSWGDFPQQRVHVRGTRTTADLLHGVHVLRTDPVALPTRQATWDPALTRIDDHWLLAFVESPSQSPFDFHPALAMTKARDPFADLQLVAAVTTRHQAEGTLIARDREGWRVLASDRDASEYSVYDRSLQRLGALSAPYGSNIPHAQVIPRPDGTWLMVTFDDTSLMRDVVGYGAHGSVIVMASG